MRLRALVCPAMVIPILLSLALSLSPARAEDSGAGADWLKGQLADLTSLYKHLHQNPELSFHEVESAKRIAAELRQVGAEVTEGVGGHGVVGVLRNGEGPTVLVRADMDALPVTEATGLPYASEVQTRDDSGDEVGVMHACGHDIHMTCLVGTARWLGAHKDQWKGTVVLIGQPAEEKIAGAKQMLEDGLYERFPKPDAALALHVAPDLETGKVGYASGPAMASSTGLDLIVRGRGGHGAMPHGTIDPIVLSSLLVLDLQTIVSREVSPIKPAVVTVGSIQGGTKHNVIPAEVHLQLSLRAYDEEVRQQLIEGIRRRAENLAKAHRAPEPTMTIRQSTPSTINTPSLVSEVVPAIEEALGAENVMAVDPSMGSEDFGLYNRDGVPIFMFWLGTISPDRIAKAEAEGGKPLPILHSPFYYPDPEPSIQAGVRAMTSAVVRLLQP